MEVNLLEPFGFCGGVLRALSVIKRAKEEHPSETIYLIGALVHNEKVLENLKSEGFVLIDGTRKEIEDKLKRLPLGSVVCFSAHGHPSSFFDIAKNRSCFVYDATCPFVAENEKKVREALLRNEKVFFVGKKGHAEAEAIRSIDPKNIWILSTAEDIPSLSEGKIHVFSQTTMAFDEVATFEVAIKKRFKDVQFEKTRCLDATRRQSSLERKENYDAIVILGSKTSNNSQKLLGVAKELYPDVPSYLCLDLEEVKKTLLKGKRKILLGSGASSAKEEVLAVKDYLECL